MRPLKRCMRTILTRSSWPSRARRAGTCWLAKLECGHSVPLSSQRGAVAKRVHCGKCELGLVRAEPCKFAGPKDISTVEPSVGKKTYEKKDT